MESFERIANVISEALGPKVWVVGGAVRDRLLGREINEYDLLVDTASLQGPHWWKEQDRTAFWLDEQRQMLRVSWLPDGPTIDLSLLHGDLASDLRLRDFTVNSLAVSLRDWFLEEPSVIDPTSGCADLKARLVKATSKESLSSDPVRILRGIRLALSLQLVLGEETILLMQRAAWQLPKSPAERVSAELLKILLDPAAPSGTDYLALVGATETLLPEVAAMRGITQNEHHQYTVDDHSQKAFAAFVDILHQLKHVPLAVRHYVDDYWRSLSANQQGAVMLAAWLHDIGKPPTRAIRKDRVTFYGHEHVGADMGRNIARRLLLSREQTDLITTFIKYHMYPMQLWRTGSLDDRLTHRLYRRVGKWSIPVILFTLADHLAKGENVADSETFHAHQAVVERLVRANFEQAEIVVNPMPLLSGQEIAEYVGRKPGPWLRRTQELLLEAQAGGELADLAGAIAFVRRVQSDPELNHKPRRQGKI